MSAVEQSEKKTCPKCKQTDTTTFSTCRNCGTRYDFTQQVKHKEAAIGMPLFLSVLFVLAAFCVYQFYQMQSTYKNPDKLIGKIMHCQQKGVLASASADNLLKFDAAMEKAAKKDPRKYGSKGIGGMLGAASVLNSLAAGEDTVYGLMYNSMRSGEIVHLSSGDTALLSVVILAAKTTPTNSIVQVRVANGPKCGGVYWINSSDLDLVTK